MLNPGEFAEVRLPVSWGHVAGRWYGDQTVRPLLALHGWLDNCGTFAKLAPLLLPTVGSALCIDLPGHGLSAHLPAGMFYDNLAYVRVILHLMEVYKWPKVSLLGHSLGAEVAFHFAALYPARVDVIVSIDVVKRHHFPNDVWLSFLKHSVEKALIDNERALQRTEANEPPSYTFAQCERLLYEGSDRSVNLENCKYLLERNLSKSTLYPAKYYFTRDARLKYLGGLNANEALASAMAQRICSVALPFLVVKCGASFNMSSQAATDVLTAHNPHFEQHKITSGTHHLRLNDPESVAELVNAFLLRHRPLEVIKAEVNLSTRAARAKL